MKCTNNLKKKFLARAACVCLLFSVSAGTLGGCGNKEIPFAYNPNYEAVSYTHLTRIGNGYSSDYAAQISCKVMQYYFNPEKEEEIISGTANHLEAVTSAGD